MPGLLPPPPVPPDKAMWSPGPAGELTRPWPSTLAQWPGDLSRGAALRFEILIAVAVAIIAMATLAKCWWMHHSEDKKKRIKTSMLKANWRFPVIVARAEKHDKRLEQELKHRGQSRSMEQEQEQEQEQKHRGQKLVDYLRSRRHRQYARLQNEPSVGNRSPGKRPTGQPASHKGRARTTSMGMVEGSQEVLRPRCDVLVVFPELAGTSTCCSKQMSEEEKANIEKKREHIKNKLRDRLFVEDGPQLDRPDEYPLLGCLLGLKGAKTLRLSTRHAARLSRGRLARAQARSTPTSTAARKVNTEHPTIETSTLIPECCRNKEAAKQVKDWVDNRLQHFDERLLPIFDKERASALSPLHPTLGAVAPRYQSGENDLRAKMELLENLIKEDRVQRLLRKLATHDGMNKRVLGSAEKWGPFEPFLHAPDDEWIADDAPELFTSMERVHLIKLLLEAGIDEGGCEIDLLDMENSEVMYLVPIHDGLRTRTSDYKDDEADDVQAPSASTGGAAQPALAASAPSPARMRLRLAGLTVIAENARRLVELGKLRASMPHLLEGTLIQKWYRDDFVLLPNQPLDDIRDYLGEEAALYFLFLQHLTSWQCIPGFIGLVPIAGWVYYGTMDNWLSSVYSVVVLVWAYLFVKYWERHRRKWAYKWNVEHAREEEKIRPQFTHEAKKEGSRDKELGLYSAEGHYVEIGEDEAKALDYEGDARRIQKKDRKELRIPKFDHTQRYYRLIISYLSMSLLMLLSFFITLLIMSFRSFMMGHFFILEPGDAWFLDWWQPLYTYRTIVASAVSALPQTVWISFSNWVGNRLAHELNDWENHRTQVDFEHALLTKKFLIQFVNAYSSLFYVAFFKSTSLSGLMTFFFNWLNSFTGSSGVNVEKDYCHSLVNFTMTHDEILLENGGLNPFCMAELSSLLASLVIMRVLVSDLLIGMLLPYYRYRARDHLLGKISFYERQARLEQGDKNVMAECLELVIKLGYVVLFAPAFPVAAFVVYLSLMVKLRVDAYNWLKLRRRPFPKRVQEIAGLRQLLIVIGAAGLVTNTALLFFTATQFTTLLPFTIPLIQWTVTMDNRFVFFVVCEHIIILCQYAVSTCIGDDETDIDKLRSKSKWRDPRWRNKLLKEIRNLRKGDVNDKVVLSLPGSSGRGDPSKLGSRLGPFKLVDIEWERLELKVGQNGWQIDQRSLLLQTESRKLLLHGKDSSGSKSGGYSRRVSQSIGSLTQQRGGLSRQGTETTLSSEAFYPTTMDHNADVSEQDSVAGGRISQPEPITLTVDVMKKTGINTKACFFAFAYPLSGFTSSHPLSKAKEEALLTDLELDLHSAIDRFDAEMRGPTLDDAWPKLDSGEATSPDVARDRALRFLSTGGYIYFDMDLQVLQVTTLLPVKRDEIALDFGTPMTWSSEQSEAQSELASELPLESICRSLLRQGAFHPPTLPELVRKGVTGFYWLQPREAVAADVGTTQVAANGGAKAISDEPTDDTVVGNHAEDEEKAIEHFISSHKEEGLQNRFGKTRSMLRAHMEIMQRAQQMSNNKHAGRALDAKQMAQTFWPDGAFVYIVRGQTSKSRGQAQGGPFDFNEAHLFPVRHPMLGLEWSVFVNGEEPPPTLGLKWRKVSSSEEPQGQEIIHSKLCSKLEEKSKAGNAPELTRDELTSLVMSQDIKRLKPDSYIRLRGGKKAGGSTGHERSYFLPSGNQIVDKPMLEKLLLKKGLGRKWVEVSDCNTGELTELKHEQLSKELQERLLMERKKQELEMKKEQGHYKKHANDHMAQSENVNVNHIEIPRKDFEKLCEAQALEKLKPSHYVSVSLADELQPRKFRPTCKLDKDQFDFTQLNLTDLRPDSFIRLQPDTSPIYFRVVDPSFDTSLESSIETFEELRRYYQASKTVARYAALYIRIKKFRHTKTRSGRLPIEVIGEQRESGPEQARAIPR